MKSPYARDIRYRIIVSDLLRRRPIWFGGQDRSEQSMDEFFKWLGTKKSKTDKACGHGHVESVS